MRSKLFSLLATAVALAGCGGGVQLLRGSNTVITLDAHDAITLSGVIKAQLLDADFHF